VFCSNRDGTEDLFITNVDGTAVTNILRHPDIVFESSWSPDGRQIAFYSNRDGDFEIFVMNADGTRVRRLTLSLPGEQQ